MNEFCKCTGNYIKHIRVFTRTSPPFQNWLCLRFFELFMWGFPIAQFLLLLICPRRRYVRWCIFLRRAIFTPQLLIQPQCNRRLLNLYYVAITVVQTCTYLCAVDPAFIYCITGYVFSSPPKFMVCVAGRVLPNILKK